MAKRKNVEVDLKQQVRNCRLFYKLGLVPSEEELDPTPLTVPLDCETPLTRKEKFQMFGYGTYSSNPNLYDDDDGEDDFGDGVMHSEFPLSNDVVNEDTGLTVNEQVQADAEKLQAEKDALWQQHLQSQASASIHPTEAELKAGASDDTPAQENGPSEG